jgi:anaerobic selenocysteine-containing dehydrogenase
MARTACILCSRNCGLEVEVAEGHLTAVRGDTQHPQSAGYLCQKAARLDHYQNNDDRLSYPLRRNANGGFERVSWDQALDEIAAKLRSLRRAHGGECFAFYGGGGQGNHLGAAYSTSLLFAMRSPYRYNALAQEKTGDFWVNGKIFGRQDCHVSEDVERADLVLFIGTNPWQAHGIRNARRTMQELARDSKRSMVVIDPRRTETAKLADVHLQLRPGTDAFLMAALLAIMLREDLLDRGFIAAHTHGFSALEPILKRVPIDDYLARADVPRVDVERVARMLARARAACVRVDLGLQQSLHSTLNSYLEKLLFLLTGNFAKPGGNNLHTFFLPIFIHSYELLNTRTVVARMPAIGGIYPPNVLPGEIDSDHPKRVRALFVDSANPMVSAADSAAYERALRKLELLVVVDVAMTETARLAHYILPAASQFEKWEATGFNLDFPRNHFHLRAPLFPPRAETLPEPEIYTRLLHKLGALPSEGFPRLQRLARLDRRRPELGLFWIGLAATMLLRPKLTVFGSHVLQQTIGKTFPDGADAAAPLWFLAHVYALRYRAAVRRAGHRGRGLMLGEALFREILHNRSGTVVSEHEYADTWSLVAHRKLRLAVPEMLAALRALEHEALGSKDLPFMLIAGERRTYNANTILRDPSWRKSDPEGALSMHPSDAARLGLREGERAQVRSATGELQITVHLSDTLRPGVVSLPHGYGMRYRGGPENGPALNRLTSANHCDPIAATPFHKNVPVAIRAS